MSAFLSFYSFGLLAFSFIDSTLASFPENTTITSIGHPKISQCPFEVNAVVSEDTSSIDIIYDARSLEPATLASFGYGDTVKRKCYVFIGLSSNTNRTITAKNVLISGDVSLDATTKATVETALTWATGVNNFTAATIDGPNYSSFVHNATLSSATSVDAFCYKNGAQSLTLNLITTFSVSPAAEYKSPDRGQLGSKGTLAQKVVLSTLDTCFNNYTCELDRYGEQTCHHW